MLLVILIAILITAIASYFVKGHILISLFLAICGLYELSGPLLYTRVFDDDLIPAQQIFGVFASDDTVNSFVLGLYLFFVILNLSYVLTSRLFYDVDKRTAITNEANANVFHVLIIVVFVFGVISVYT